jgi:hypothetical protein
VADEIDANSDSRAPSVDLADDLLERDIAIPVSRRTFLDVHAGMLAQPPRDCGDVKAELCIVTLEKASTTYEEQGDLKAFDEAVQAGASSNMCDALLGFSGVDHNRTFEITVTASVGPLFESQPKKFEFDGK